MSNIDFIMKMTQVCKIWTIFRLRAPSHVARTIRSSMSSVYGSAIFVASVLAAGVASALQKSKTKPRSTPCHPLSTMGALYNPEFLSIVAPLYDMHMGCENMGPMLYALVRFLKPRKVLEIGAG